MTYKSNPANQAADKIAEQTGVPRLKKMAGSDQRAKRQIVLPGIAIAGSIIAFVATLYGMRVIGALGPLFFIIAMLAQYFGPIRLRDAARPYDECEQLLVWRSRSIGLGTGLAIAIIGCSALSLNEALQDLHDVPLQLPKSSAFAAMWLLATTATGLTTISASLVLPKDIEDEVE